MKRGKRLRNKLTDKQVRNSKPGLLGDGDGLWLKTRERERGITRRFVFRYRREGIYKEIPIGRFPDTDLAEARKKASAYRATLDDDRNPASEVRAARVANKVEAAKAKAAEIEARFTFRVAAQEWAANIGEKKWRSARVSAAFTSNMKRNVFPHIGDMAIADIDRKTAIAMLKPIAAVSLHTTHRIRGWAENVYAFAAAQLDIENANPFAWDKLKAVFPAKPTSGHFRALPYTELPGLYARLSDMGDAPDALAARLQIALALRPSEARTATFAMIDEAAATITWKMTKTGRAFTAPLNDAALAVLERCRAVRSSDTLFAGRDGHGLLASRAIYGLVARLTNGCSAHATSRSGFSDYMYETQPQIPESVVEAALNHVFGNKVTRAYKRLDQLALRREAMKIWSDYLLGVEPASNVVPFKKASWTSAL
jgi:integrase